jgi:hypothetical protein
MGYATPITCAHTIPQDDVWDEDTLIRPSGRAASRIIADLLTSGGYTADEPEPDMGHHSWTFNASKDGDTFWVQVSDIDETELVIAAEELRGCVWPFGGGGGKANALLDYLFGVMERDDRFSQLEWYN